MPARLAERARKLRVDRDARHPRKALAGKDQRPGVAVLTRHARVDEDVLELARASTPERAEAKTRPAVADPQLRSLAQVHRAAVVAPGAGHHLEPRGCFRPVPRGDHLHELTHDTETQAAGKIDAPPSPAGPW